MKHSSIMWRYIDEEPGVLNRLLASGQTDALAKTLAGVKTVYFVAHGSSFNAATCAAGFFAKAAGIRAYAYTPGNFACLGSSIAMEEPSTTLVVVISQTGTSAGALQGLKEAHALGFRVLGITAVEHSPVAAQSDHTLFLLCGDEDSNAKTKGYSATLMTLFLLAVSMGSENGTLDCAKRQAYLDELSETVRAIPQVLERAMRFCEETAFGEGLHNLYVLGSGLNFGTAQEGQLKLMETMCIPTMFNDVGEFSHGMHRSIDADSSLLLLCGPDDMADQIRQAYAYLCGITKRVCLIDATGEATPDERCISVPRFALTQSVLLITLVIQVLSVYAPERCGMDPNRDAHNDFTLVAGTRV